MDLLIITPEKELLHVFDVDLIDGIGTDGRFQILKDHADMLILLTPGWIIYKKNNIKKKVNLPLNNAVLRVKNNKIMII